MSVPKYIAIMYGRSQKAAQIMFNQPENRNQKDNELLDQIWADSTDSEQLSGKFIQHILGSDTKILNNIQTTIYSKFQSREACNTVKSLTRPILSNYPEMQQLQMVIDKYYFSALAMQKAQSDAKDKQDKAEKCSSVRIPYTIDQIKKAFMVVIDMCKMIIDLKSGDSSPIGKEVKARSHVLLASAAIQIGRYDIVESDIALWCDMHEFHKDPDVPLRIRNLLYQKEMLVLKRKGEEKKAMIIAKEQWEKSKDARWMDKEPLVFTGLELALLDYKFKSRKSKSEDNIEFKDSQNEVISWLKRFDDAPDRAEEIGKYLQNDPAIEPLRYESGKSPFKDIWSKMMKKFGIMTIFILGIMTIGFVFGSLNLGTEHKPVIAQHPSLVFETQALNSAQVDGDQIYFIVADANPGQLIWDIIKRMLSFSVNC